MNEQHQELINRMMAGDRDCFHEIVQLYSEDVMRLSYSLLWNEEEAKDVLQETMLKLVTCLKNGKLRTNNGSIKGFLMTTSRNMCIDRLRRKNDFIHEINSDNVTSPTNSNIPEQIILINEDQIKTQFQKSLKNLSPLQRTVLVMHDVHDEKLKQISHELNITENSAKVHLHHARKKMRQYLAPFMRNHEERTQSS